jgi:lactose/L-arabinose transport system permease protein
MKKIKNPLGNGRGFLIIPIIMISMLVFVPMIFGLITSFQTGTPLNMQFAGLANYKRLLSDATFITALKNTFLYLIIQVPVMLFLAIIISNFLNDKKLKFKGLYRTAIFLPCITSLVSYSLVMKSIFANDGIINSLLMNLHLISDPIKFITDPFWAKVVIIISITWRWTGYNMIFFLSGMQNIDPSIYEAAEVDGASKWEQLIKITIPNLKPIILFTSITSTIGTLQLFDEIVNITGGGPANASTTISMYIYNLMFKFTPQFGYAAAMAFVVSVLIIILSAIQNKVGAED